jgi:hypothetical protein
MTGASGDEAAPDAPPEAGDLGPVAGPEQPAGTDAP